MLSYKISSKDVKRDVRALNALRTVQLNNGVITVTAQGHGLSDGDVIEFARSEGGYIYFYEEVPVNSVIDSEKFTILDFTERNINVSAGNVIEKRYNPQVVPRKYLMLFTNTENDFVEYRTDPRYDDRFYIREFIYGNYTDYGNIKRCDNDYVLYEDTFLYRATVDSATGKYVFGSNYVNTRADVLVTPRGVVSEYLLNHSGNGAWQITEDGRICLKSCIIPVKKDGRNDRNVILWDAEDLELAELIARNTRILDFKCKDVRFIDRATYEPNTGSVQLTNGTSIQKTSYTAVLTAPILQDIGTNLFQEDQIRTSYIDRLVNNIKNGIVDYEKKCFVPVYFNQEANSFEDAESVQYNLHFRQRPITPIYENDVVVSYTYNDWKTEDNFYWNNYPTKRNGTLVPKEGISDASTSDLLGYLGFTDEDIIQERNRVSHSFLRLSFYDAPDRRTQKLLFTSTLFLNTGELYEQYSSNVRSNAPKTGSAVDGGDGEYVYTEDAPERICASFRATDRYTTKTSSEGFYLYLFPGLLDENGEGEIYMKAEFNHAKYGYTIPFIMPVDKNYTPIAPTDAEFPSNYIELDGDKEFVDVQRLFGDMYIKINIKYDSASRRYVWYMPYGETWGKKFSFNLFEPRINATDSDLRVKLNKTTVSASGETIYGKVIIPFNKTWKFVGTDPSVDGMEPSPSGGTGITEIEITVPERTDIEEEIKAITLTFECIETEEKFGVTVEQSSHGYDFSVSPDSVTGINWDGGIFNITITDENEYGWIIDTEGNTEVTPALTDGNGSAVIPVVVAQNSTTAVKEMEISVIDKLYGVSHRITVEQQTIVGTVVWEWDDSSAGEEFDWREGGSFIMTLTDLDDLGATLTTNLDNSWITLENVRQDGTEWYYTFIVAENKNRAYRSMTISFVDGRYGILKESVVVVQMACERGDSVVTLSAGSVEFEIPESYEYVSSTVQWTAYACFVDEEGTEYGGDLYSGSGTSSKKLYGELYKFPTFAPSDQGKTVKVKYHLSVYVRVSSEMGTYIHDYVVSRDFEHMFTILNGNDDGSSVRQTTTPPKQFIPIGID